MSAFRVTVGANVHARRRIVSSCKGVCSINSRAVRHVGRTVEARAGKAENDANCESLEDDEDAAGCKHEACTSIHGVYAQDEDH